MSDKPYPEMDDAELTQALKDWEGHVETATGFASAHCAAQQVDAICRHAAKRGLAFQNRFPIRYG